MLKNTDIQPVVLEETPYIGGISRTHVHNGSRMDLGGHRFFTKNDEVMNFWSLWLTFLKTIASELSSVSSEFNVCYISL
ncbi:MAG: NAD(P)-binding protein [Candidatus Gastranaerophilales bacterium]|nr:NAD(P)-binding protein [Candidatus Gastranaerophilales bacterium]